MDDVRWIAGEGGWLADDIAIYEGIYMYRPDPKNRWDKVPCAGILDYIWIVRASSG